MISDWIFNFYEGSWRAAKREHYKDLFNDYSSPNVISSSKMETLLQLIEISGGDIDKINELFSEIDVLCTKKLKGI